MTSGRLLSQERQRSTPGSADLSTNQHPRIEARCPARNPKKQSSIVNINFHVLNQLFDLPVRIYVTGFQIASDPTMQMIRRTTMHRRQTAGPRFWFSKAEFRSNILHRAQKLCISYKFVPESRSFPVGTGVAFHVVDGYISVQKAAKKDRFSVLPVQFRSLMPGE